MMFLVMMLLVFSLAPIGRAKVQFMGMNIAGFDFGCQTDGTCTLSSAQTPNDGAGQMQHFVSDDQMNTFRFPVSWQYLVNGNIGGTLDATNFGKYDQLMQACLSTGAYCAIDIHNFARVSTKIIGQGGPSDDQFADLWSQLATKYRDEEKVIFGLMNEPHDVDISIWANTVQAAVSAIRDTGATSQLILMPGNNFASAGQFVSNGSGAALLNVKNPNGTIDGLIMDLHKYLDVDNSGEHSTCTTDNINDAFAIVAAFLRENGRQGLVSETGAGSDSSCFTDFCAQNAYLNENSDVFLGYIAWAAGSFSTSYVLSLTPSKKNGKYIDTALASQCVIAPWLSAGTQIVTSAVPILTTQSTAASTSTSRGSQSLPVTSTAMGSTALTTSPGVFLGSSQNSKTSVPVVTQSTNGTIAGSTLTASITNPTKSTPTQSFTSAAYLGAIRNPLFTAASCLLATFLT